MAHDIADLRKKELQKDEGVKLIINKGQTSQKFTEAIKKKRKELENVTEATKSTLKGAGAEADRIIGEAKIKASVLISQATSDKKLATSLLDRAETKKQELEVLATNLEQKEKDVNTKKEKVDNQENVVIQKQEDVDELLKTASQRKEDIVDIFETSVALLQLVIENMEQFQKLNSEGVVVVGDIFEKSVRILKIATDSLQRAKATEKYVKTEQKKIRDDRESLTAREKEVQSVAEKARALTRK
jgi:hypothetical protein